MRCLALRKRHQGGDDDRLGGARGFHREEIQRIEFCRRLVGAVEQRKIIQARIPRDATSVAYSGSPFFSGFGHRQCHDRFRSDLRLASFVHKFASTG